MGADVNWYRTDMTGHAPYAVSVAIAAVIGGAGFPMAVLAWRRFRGAPFGDALAPLPWFMLLLAVYHPILLALPAGYGAALVLESLAFALLALFSLQMVRVHRRLSRMPGPGGRS